MDLWRLGVVEVDASSCSEVVGTPAAEKGKHILRGKLATFQKTEPGVVSVATGVAAVV